MSPLTSDGSRDSQAVRLDSVSGCQKIKTLKTNLNLKGGLPGSSPLGSDGSCGSQAGRLDHINGGQRCSMESQKMTLGSQETYFTMGRVRAQEESTYSFSGDVEEVR